MEGGYSLSISNLKGGNYKPFAVAQTYAAGPLENKLQEILPLLLILRLQLLVQAMESSGGRTDRNSQTVAEAACQAHGHVLLEIDAT